MSEDEFRRERLYQRTMSVFKKMLEDGLISKEEYAEIDTRMTEKYSPKYGSLLARIDLIN